MSTHVPQSLPDDVLNIRKRLEQQRLWCAEWKVEDDALRQMLQELDPDNPKDRIRGRQITQEIDRIAWKRTKDPIEVSPEALKRYGFDAYRQYLVEQFAALSDEERLLWLDNFQFMKTPDLRQLEAKLDRVREYRSFGQRRNFLIGGNSGMGKTTGEEWYVSIHPPIIEAERNNVPVIKVDAPVSNKSARTLLVRIIQAFGRTYTKGLREEELLDLAVMLLYRCGTEILIVDEVEHIHTYELKRRFLEFSNLARQVTLVCSSCNPRDWVTGDAEVAGRWNDCFILKPYKGKRLVALLAMIELLLPFTQPSDLTSSTITKFIEEWSGGILREITMLIQDASTYAIRHKQSNLTLNILKESAKNLRAASAAKNQAKTDDDLHEE